MQYLYYETLVVELLCAMTNLFSSSLLIPIEYRERRRGLIERLQICFAEYLLCTYERLFAHFLHAVLQVASVFALNPASSTFRLVAIVSPVAMPLLAQQHDFICGR